ncbi:hypothetical protein BDP27DRAFT_533698 [Rhodocollybia butyracea]|uniref:RING-type domain-containing protein n=1 Tax=Rhodocollybia butyracea TaxID=206335 RepID=A0A9P5PS04_9AGAR|nr:hypothetical protein BDP27DRAFT_533698 [Rhodocollybia butyracea]
MAEALEGQTKSDDTYSSVLTTAPSPAPLSLKRPTSPTFHEDASSSRKRFKESEGPVDLNKNDSIIESKLADDLAQELECGCCSELLYKPVMVTPCQHFFCGSCCQLWIRNGGTSCPACRSVSTTASPSRPLQLVLDTLLRSAPHKARAIREREQADEIYKSGTTMRFPSPREASPEPLVNISAEYARPCPHCSPNNPYGWICPQPIPDPVVDPDHAWHLDDGIPTGHSQCGNCETFLALNAPTTTKCDFCLVRFCGVEVPTRCSAVPVILQQPHGFSDMGDLVVSTDVYESFGGNAVEVDILLDYLSAQDLSPRHIYRDIVKHIQEQPRQFLPLVESELFDIHTIPNMEHDPSAPHNRICRQCACEIFIWGLKDWWVRERKKGFLEEHVMNRKDCPKGDDCMMQKDLVHAKEFNHIFGEPKGNELAVSSIATTSSSEDATIAAPIAEPTPAAAATATTE